MGTPVHTLFLYNCLTEQNKTVLNANVSNPENIIILYEIKFQSSQQLFKIKATQHRFEQKKHNGLHQIYFLLDKAL